MQPSGKSNIKFFWDKKNKKQRSRFNLLLLEYGEYFLEDLSAYLFPVPTDDLSQHFEVKDGLKIQGRLKLCTRSLVFEPSDIRKPIMKFPYKTMSSSLEVFQLKEMEKAQLSVELAGFFTFLCQSYFEMKVNNKVAPYKLIDSSVSNASDFGVGEEESKAARYRILIALVHSDLSSFLVKVEQFRHIQSVAKKQGVGMGNQLLQPFLEMAQITSFDTSHLVDFHEQLLLKAPVAVRKIKPLIVNPGSLMVTDYRIYFQPSPLNNIGDSSSSSSTVQVFDLRKVSRVYRRRYLLRQIGLELFLGDGSCAFFTFETPLLRDEIFQIIMAQQNLASRSNISLEAMTRRWQRKEVSNFDYLMHLNSEADRSINDLTQYPVWVYSTASPPN